MPVQHTRSGAGQSFWAKLWQKAGIARPRSRSEKREYTLMIVPHHGKNVRSFRLPVRALQFSAAALGVLAVLTIGTFVSYRYALNVASTERAELEQLRQVNVNQHTQIEELAKATAVLQDDMNRLNKLDADIRKMVNSDELPASRSGITRPVAGHSGQGGPTAKPEVNDLVNLVQELQATAKAREQSLTALQAALVDRNARLAATPSVWPTSGDVTSRFGWRGSPWGWGNDWHPGIDIANDYGTPIMATADGEVSYSGWYSGYGKLIQIDHGNGIVTLYGHNSELLVNVGDRVKKGQVIAHMGSTGNSTGAHCHYEVRVNGTAVNPANFL